MPDGNGGTLCSTDNDNWTDSATPIYQTAGAGNYYLAPNSPYRGIGTAPLTPGLLTLLTNRTTWPPIVYANTTFTSPTTLSPAVPATMPVRLITATITIPLTTWWAVRICLPA